jgi:uncharacterized protein (TIGR02453 family)
MAGTFEGFGPETIEFLVDLSNHNRREWFQENRQRYEDHFLAPAQAFIRAMKPHLAKIAPSLEASDKKQGGSLMRIYRDVRFSKDKSPYKTNIGIHFRHVLGKDVHAPGAYVHVGVDGCFFGLGVYRPPSADLRRIREKIVAEAPRWKRITRNEKLLEVWRLGGDSLKRGPKGFDPEHELIEDLKRKDHVLMGDLTVDQVGSRDFVKLCAQRFRTGRKYLEFVSEALEVPV